MPNERQFGIWSKLVGDSLMKKQQRTKQKVFILFAVEKATDNMTVIDIYSSAEAAERRFDRAPDIYCAPRYTMHIIKKSILGSNHVRTRYGFIKYRVEAHTTSLSRAAGRKQKIHLVIVKSLIDGTEWILDVYANHYAAHVRKDRINKEVYDPYVISKSLKDSKVLLDLLANRGHVQERIIRLFSTTE